MPDKVDLTRSSGSNKTTVPFWSRIHNRITEMRERRKKLYRMQFKNNANGKRRKADFKEDFTALLQRKRDIMAQFDSMKLESALKESTKATALELVRTLIPSDGQ